MDYEGTDPKKISIAMFAIIAIIIAISISLILFHYKTMTISNNSNLSNTSSKAVARTGGGRCDPSLWNFIANLAGSFKILNRCVTVTGTVLSNTHQEPDGDVDFPLSLDPPYKNMVTKANFNPIIQGGIWCEIICQHSEVSSKIEPFKRGECNGFNGRLILNLLPQISQHLRITGTYLLDMREGGHSEIHPVSSIQLLVK